MARYGVVALLSCFLVAGSVWLVQSEGQAYREELARARQTDRADSVVAISKLGEKAKPPAANAVAESDASRPSPPSATTGPAPEAPAQPPLVDTKAQPSVLPVRAGGTPPVPSAASARPAASAGDVPKSAPRLADRDPFWNQPYLNKQWDLDHFTAQDENALGEELHNLIIELNPRDNGSGRQRVITAARQLLDLRDRKNVEYTVTILDSDIPNAFSHPGGFIYLSRGLLEMFAEDEDYLIEFVVCHEIAHKELQHALQCLRDQRVRKFKDGTLQKLYFLILPHAYPRELEFAADRWVYQRMRRLGRTDHDRLAFLRKLDGYAKANGFDDGQGKVEELYKQWGGKPGVAPTISPIENHLRAHTAAWERLSQLKQFTEKAAKVPN